MFFTTLSKVSGKEYNNELESLLEMCYNASVDYLPKNVFLKNLTIGERDYILQTPYIIGLKTYVCMTQGH